MKRLTEVKLKTGEIVKGQILVTTDGPIVIQSQVEWIDGSEFKIEKFDMIDPFEDILAFQLTHQYKELLMKDFKYQCGNDEYGLTTAECEKVEALKIILNDLKTNRD